MRTILRVLLNEYMAKTPKELAFLRDLYISGDWTRRFTDLIDKNFDFGLFFLALFSGDIKLIYS